MRSAIIWLRIVAIAALAVVALGAWAFSSPVGSAPDEAFHLSSIYCSSSAPSGLCTPVSDIASPPSRATPRRYLVPIGVAQAGSCFKHQPLMTGRCQEQLFRNPALEVVTSDLNSSGTYPSGYYWIMGHFASSDVRGSVYAMRVINAFVFVILLLAVIAVSAPALRQAGGVGVVLAGGPLGWFLVSSVNPSAWAFIGVGLYWIAALAHATADRSLQRWAAFALAMILLVMACAARSDSAGYIILVTIAVVALAARRDMARSRLVSLAALSAIACAVSLITFATTSGVTDFAGSPLALNTGHGLNSVLFNLAWVPQISIGAIGLTPLGWLDTQLPFIVPLLAIVTVTVVVIEGLRISPRRNVHVWVYLVALVVLLPIVMLYRNDTAAISFFVQPRYMLPLLPIVFGLPLLGPNPLRARPLSRPYRVLFLTATAVIFSVSLFWNTDRYVKGLGLGAPGLDLSSGAQWWSNSQVGPMWNWAIGTAAFIGVVALALPVLMPREIPLGDQDEGRRPHRVPRSPRARLR